jgi:hypothetical protein
VIGRFAAGAAVLRSALADRLFPQPVDSVARLAQFVGSRAAYVGQTALYGYLKTRMGTRFPQYFEDEEYAASIRAATELVFAACAGDLAIYAAALTGDDGRLDAAAAAALARRLFADAFSAGGASGPDDVVRAAFAGRAAQVNWPDATHSMDIFAGSADAVIRYAPVSDEFKDLDDAIVRNSVRFRWLDVRQRLGRRLDPLAVCAEWRGAGGR